MARKKSRRNKLIILYFCCVTSIILAILSFVIYNSITAPVALNYYDKSNIDYKVYLKDNEFYEESYLEKDNQYISNLIDTINTKFDYSLRFSNKINYEYSYKVIAEIEVKEVSNDNTIYTFSEELYKSDSHKNTGKLTIDRDIDVNYAKYNEIINNFKNVYELRNTNSYVDVALYLTINNIPSSKDIIDKKVANIKMPLSENTISIENNFHNVENTYVMSIKPSENYKVLLLIGIILVIESIAFIAIIHFYKKRTRTAKMIYEKEIKNIMKNYDSYIQRISGKYKIGTSQVIKIETFNDILEIRDTLKQPILMLENEQKNGTFFIIPATNNIIYTYALRVVDIEAKMKGKEVPSYEITEIAREDFMKNKKYTHEYIQDELTKTSMRAVDNGNIIKGKSDPEKDLYEQLELTRSFSIEEIKKAIKEAKRHKKMNMRRKAHNKNK